MVTRRYNWRRLFMFLLVGGILVSSIGIPCCRADIIQRLENKRGHNVMCLVHPRNCRGGFKKRTSLKTASDKEAVISKEWLWILQRVSSAIQQNSEENLTNRNDFEIDSRLFDNIGQPISPDVPVA